ncbi:hypothetical protein Bca52824_010263 [Brassica carinata]|uniref:RRM domain-containing protein n=1 Tax=Brassica carinata TaxID=52824 RepID=A0A8X8B9Z2_BRACI|nr:hypothetical protein Bca52824_010263 [Brassica carinata]
MIGKQMKVQFCAYGGIESIIILVEKACASVTYTARGGAEKAAEELSNKLFVKGQRLKISWGRPQVPKTDPDVQYYIHPPPSQHPHQERLFYPSMDPRRMGAVISSQDSGSNTSDNREASSSSYPMPPHGHYTQQPCGGYMQRPYQQYPPYHHGPPQATHPYPILLSAIYWFHLSRN